MGVDLIFLLSIFLIIFVMLLFIVLEDRRKILCVEKEKRAAKAKEAALAGANKEPETAAVSDNGGSNS